MSPIARLLVFSHDLLQTFCIRTACLNRVSQASKSGASAEAGKFALRSTTFHSNVSPGAAAAPLFNRMVTAPSTVDLSRCPPDIARYARCLLCSSHALVCLAAKQSIEPTRATLKHALKGSAQYCDRLHRNALHITALSPSPTAVTAEIVKLLINKNISVSKADYRCDPLSASCL
jgi:hypothetical protein